MWISNPKSTKPIKKKKHRPKRLKPCWFCEKPDFPSGERCFLCGYDHAKDEIPTKAKSRIEWLDETEQQMARFNQTSTGCRIDLELNERKRAHESVSNPKNELS